jgi:hypothetical protein
MTEANVTVDEWYPVFRLTEDNTYGDTCEFSDEELARIKAAFEEFRAMQELLEARWNLAQRAQTP